MFILNPNERLKGSDRDSLNPENIKAKGRIRKKIYVVVEKLKITGR